MVVRRGLASISRLMSFLLVLLTIKSPHIALVVHPWLILLQLIRFILLRLSKIKGIGLNVLSMYLVSEVLLLQRGPHILGGRN